MLIISLYVGSYCIADRRPLEDSRYYCQDGSVLYPFPSGLQHLAIPVRDSQESEKLKGNDINSLQ